MAGSWEGPLAWRKPILFGLSAGVTLWSLGWVLGRLPRWKIDGLLSAGLSLSLLLEVFLITLQTWRGVASHYNRSTSLDSAINLAMGALITVALGRHRPIDDSLLGQNQRRPSYHAIDSSRDVVLVALMFVWFWMTAYGEYQVGLGNSPELFGKAGLMKFPHGAALHAIQWLPLLLWFMPTANLSQRLRTVWWSIWGYAGLTLFCLASNLSRAKPTRHHLAHWRTSSDHPILLPRITGGGRHLLAPTQLGTTPRRFECFAGMIHACRNEKTVSRCVARKTRDWTGSVLTKYAENQS